MKPKHWIGIALLLVLVLAAYALWRNHSPEEVVYAPAPAEDTSSALVMPEPTPTLARTPSTDVEPTPDAEPSVQLPALDASDTAVRDAFAEVAGRAPVESFLVPKNIVRRMVATLDSLDQEPLPMRVRAVPKTEGGMAVLREDKRIQLLPENSARYDAFVSAVRAVDPAMLVAVYLRYYPLFQSAYEDLGYPDRNFNDRLIEVIDHLLKTPRVDLPIALEQPKVFFLYADPSLERRSSGQKTLIRMGPEHAAALKGKLRALRAQLVEQTGADEEAP